MKTYLPIGSVVLLKEGAKKIMIYGRRQTSVESEKEYDYVACLYPEGYISEKFIFLFDEDSIEKIVFRGYSDAEDERFISALDKIKT